MLFLYFICIIFAFILIPFTYFFLDEKIDEYDITGYNLLERICSSIKFTIIFLFFIVIVLISGLFFKNNHGTKELLNNNETLKWIKNLFDTENFGEKSISFCISIFSIFGMIILIFYTSYGLGVLPFYLIKGKKSLSSEQDDFELDRAKKRDKIRTLEEKKISQGLNKKEEKLLKNLKGDESHLTIKLELISDLIQQKGILDKLLSYLSPFRILLGIICLFLSLSIFSSLLISSLDRFFNSSCKIKCGYMLTEENYENIIDLILIFSSNFFHLDQIVFAIINLYIFICTIFAFCKLGIRIFCFTLFSIKKGETSPQGLILISFSMTLMIFSLILEIINLSPRYSTFGNQIQKDNSLCQLNNKNNNNTCIMTNISKFSNKISVSLPFFTFIFYIANWMVIFITGLSLFYACLCKKEKEFDDIDFGNKDFDDEEKCALKSLNEDD
jgi:LMBR1 domain-containing protein 1